MQNIQYILDDIEKALRCKAYLPALALALSLPDICGKIAYPKAGVGDRYRNWLRDTIYSEEYNKHLLPNGWDGKDMAEVMYALRNAFLHTGETLKNKTTDDDGVKINYNFELNVWKNKGDDPFTINGADKFGGSETEMGGKVVERNYDIGLNIVELCKNLSNGARVYFDKNKDNLAWQDKTVKIVYHKKVESEFGEYYATTDYQDGS